MHWIYIYIRLSQYILWMFINFIFSFFQSIWWELNGTSKILRQSSNLVQILKIQAKFKVDDYISPASKWDFLATHERFEPLEYVLQDHITLYGVSEFEVIFVEVQPGQKVWDVRSHPSFFMAAQYFSSIKIIKMSIESFNKLAEEIGDPKGELIFIENCARCRSTLLTQMFNATEKIISFGEPNCMNVLSKLYNASSDSQSVENKEFGRLVRNTIRLLCKRTQSGDEIAYVMKMTAPAITAISFLIKLLPNAKHMYLYRNPVKMAQSFYKMSRANYSARCFFHFAKRSKFSYNILASFFGFPKANYFVNLNSDLAFSMRFWFGMTLVYLKQSRIAAKAGMDVPAIRYEDIVKNSAEALKRIFNHCNLPLELVAKALEALKWDSQDGTIFSADNLRKFPTLPYEGEAKEECDRMAQQLGFPNITEGDYVIENTITKID